MAAIKRDPIIPYTYYQCPCTDVSSPPRNLGEISPIKENEDEEDGQTFDPRSPRANYSLYPLEHLLYCEDCHQIRCEKCVLDEIVTFYCPNCLFEVPGSSVKSEGNRYWSYMYSSYKLFANLHSKMYTKLFPMSIMYLSTCREQSRELGIKLSPWS